MIAGYGKLSWVRADITERERRKNSCVELINIYFISSG